MRLFASDTVKNMMRRMGMEYGESISHKMVTSSIVKAQRKVEGRNFDIRKHLLEYDDVANDQRQVIYQQRRDILEDEEISEIISVIRADVINSCISRFIPIMSVDEQWDIKGLEDALMKDFGVRLAVSQWLEADNRLDEQGLRQRIVSLVEDEYQAKVGADALMLSGETSVGKYPIRVIRIISKIILDVEASDERKFFNKFLLRIFVDKYFKK